MMGYMSFTNILCGLVLIYMAFAAKSFYDLFNPPGCDLKKSSECLYSIKNWQDDFTVS